MSGSDSIQQAQNVLAKWREGATEDRWVPRITQAVKDSLSERERVVSFGGYSDADAALIVGVAGNPALLGTINACLIMAKQAIERGVGSKSQAVALAENFAQAILAADDQMKSLD